VKQWFREWGVPLVIAVVGAALFRTYGFAQIQVVDVSMQNTFFEGHRLIEDKISYRFSEPERGDIVIIRDPDLSAERLIKRVIGLPGETIRIDDGAVWIDGVRLDEPYVKGSTYPSTLEMPYRIPPDSVFVMGDNRERSLDSRALGAIPLSSIEGKVDVRIWPFSRFGFVD
jgi:signal peptidase I